MSTEPTQPDEEQLTEFQRLKEVMKRGYSSNEAPATRGKSARRAMAQTTNVVCYIGMVLFGLVTLFGTLGACTELADGGVAAASLPFLISGPVGFIASAAAGVLSEMGLNIADEIDRGASR